MITAQEIKARFPNPRKSHMPSAHAGGNGCVPDDCYCVGGAVCRVGIPEYRLAGAFPIASLIGKALVKLNPCLPTDEAEASAWFIITFNDLGAFEAAWAEVDRVLNWRPK